MSSTGPHTERWDGPSASSALFFSWRWPWCHSTSSGMLMIARPKAAAHSLTPSLTQVYIKHTIYRGSWQHPQGPKDWAFVDPESWASSVRIESERTDCLNLTHVRNPGLTCSKDSMAACGLKRCNYIYIYSLMQE